MTLTECQEKALLKISKFLSPIDERNFYLLTGGAGVGKTYLMDVLAKKYSNIGFTAPTHKAVKVLREKINGAYGIFFTIHKLMGYKMSYNEKGGVVFSSDDISKYIEKEDYRIIVIDEVSMVSDKIFNDILSLVEKLPYLKILFVGDSYQLPPIDLGKNNEQLSKPMRLIKDCDTSHMITTKRTDETSLLDLYKIFRQSVDTFDDPRKFLNPYKKSKNIHLINNYQSFKKILLKTRTVAKSIILVQNNKQVLKYNELVKNSVKRTGPYMKGDKMVFDNFYESSDHRFYTQDIVFIESAKCVEKYNNYFEETFKTYELKIYFKFTEEDEKDDDLKSITFTVSKIDDTDKNDKNYIKFLECVKTKKTEIQEKIATMSLLGQSKKSIKQKAGDMWRFFYQSVADLNCPITDAYCMTVHKSQGSTYDLVIVDFDNIDTMYNFISKKTGTDKRFTKYRSLYTAVSRVSKEIYIKCNMKNYKEKLNINENSVKKCTGCHCVKKLKFFINQKGKERRQCKPCRSKRKHAKRKNTKKYLETSNIDENNL